MHIWASTEEKRLRGIGNKGADQPVHWPSLISPFVIRLLESIISKLAASEILIFYIASVAEQAGLHLTLSVILKTGFVTSRPIYSSFIMANTLFFLVWIVSVL